MIARRIEDGQVFDAFGLDRLDKNLIEIISSNGIAKSVSKETYTLYFDELEVQQRIEAAVEEHNKSQESPLQKVSIELADQHDQNELLRGEIKQWKWKCDRLEEEKEDLNECLRQVEAYNNEWQAENKKLHARIAELEAERQPVEVSQADADAIEWYKGKFRPWQAAALYSEGFLSSPHDKTIYTWTYDWVLQIIKRGYTVKPDPLRTRIAAILGNDHEQLDAVVAAAREGEVE